VLYYEIEGNTGMKSQDHIILKEINDNQIQRLAYARHYDADVQQLQGITLQEFGADGKVAHVENADYAEWNGDMWTMHNGIIYDIAGEEGKSEHTVRFKTQVLPISANPKQIVREQKEPEELTMKELRAQIEIMKTQYVNTSAIEAELYQRVTVPLASLIFALVGVPLGLQPTRNSSSAGFAMSVIIIFVYYALMTMGSALARSEALPPLLAVWLPNIIGLISGGLLIRRAAR
jgi:lipopolysaccharide export system permease protein